MSIDLSKYEKAKFSEKTTNISQIKYGYKVGYHLVVSYVAPNEYEYRDNEYRVYRSQDGLPAIDTTFATEKDAIRFAEWLRSIYEDHFILWVLYPYMPLFQVTHLTVENGTEYWEYLKVLKTKRGIEWKGYENDLL